MHSQAQKTLQEWETDTIDRLCHGFDVLLENAGDVLVDFASNSENLKVQNDFFDAQREIYLKGGEAARMFRAALEKLPQAARRKEVPTPGADTLSLLNNDAYELSIALDTIASRCRINNSQALHALQERLSALYGGKVVDYRHISINPHKVMEAFQESIEFFDIENRVRLVIYTLFDRYVIGRLSEIYQEINDQLASIGVLPTIRFKVRSLDHENERASAYLKPENKPNGHDKPLAERPEYAEPKPYDTVPTTEESMEAISKLLTSKLGQHNLDSPPLRSAPDPQSVRQINSMLGDVAQPQLQTNAAAMTALSSDKMIVDKQLLRRVRKALKTQREIIKSLTEKANLAPREQQLIDVVGLLFEAILDDENIPLPVKTLLSHLHTPYLKIAVNDPTFLQGKDHPARNLLDQLLRVGVRWVDTERLHQGAFPTLQYCVRKVLDDPLDIDFSHLRDKLESREKQLRHSHRLSERRTLDSARGQATLARAREMAQSAVGQITAETPLPNQVNDFLNTIFCDFLALLLLRHQLDAEHPKAREALSAVVTMVEQVNAQNHATAALAAKRLGALVTGLLPHYQQDIETFSKQLRGPLDVVPLTKRTPKLFEDEPGPPDSKEQAVLEIAAGTWFQWDRDGSKVERPIKLIWTNPHTRNLLFVDQSGVKVAHLKANEVAMQMSKGCMRVIEQTNSGRLFDGLLNNVRQRIESNRQAEA